VRSSDLNLNSLAFSRRLDIRKDRSGCRQNRVSNSGLPSAVMEGAPKVLALSRSIGDSCNEQN